MKGTPGVPGFTRYMIVRRGLIGVKLSITGLAIVIVSGEPLVNFLLLGMVKVAGLAILPPITPSVQRENSYGFGKACMSATICKY